MASENNRPVGRPKGIVLTRAKITEAAIKKLAKDGYEAFTITSLARQLEVTPAAIYNYASNKQQVIGWVEDRVMSLVDISAFARLSWREAVAAWAHSYREVMARYPALIPTIASAPIGGAPETLTMYETVAGSLEGAGFTPEEIVPFIVSVESFVYGSALDLHAPVSIFDTDEHEEEAPAFTRAMGALAAMYGPGYTEAAADAAFTAGLDALLDTAQRRLVARTGEG